MAFVDGRFCIDRWEDSLVEVSDTGQHPHSPYQAIEQLPPATTVRAVTRAGAVPQGYISRNQADSACRASSKRLCREEEWALACRGTPPREKGACNDSGISPLHVYYPEAPSTYESTPMNDPRLNQTARTVTPTGAMSRCTNALGVFDMVGNLHEWVMSDRPTFRGGYYQDTHLNGEGCAYRTTAHAAEYHDYSTGFRCCADPVDAARRPSFARSAAQPGNVR
jgi:formylglycine-generating enzyme required for sulfatase activity